VEKNCVANESAFEISLTKFPKTQGVNREKSIQFYFVYRDYDPNFTDLFSAKSERC
jgi:hypothetical protein